MLDDLQDEPENPLLGKSWMIPSPSPQPSPSGRGRHRVQRSKFENITPPHTGRRFSLSLGERVGVRGKKCRNRDGGRLLQAQPISTGEAKACGGSGSLSLDHWSSVLQWWLVLLSLFVSTPPSNAAGQYTLAFWREIGGYENHAAPAGGGGIYAAFVHVWDENGQPLAGKQIYTSWGVLLGTTDPNGFVEIELRRPNGYDFQVRDGAQLTDTTPVLSVERPPNWGHYSFEIGFLFKQDSTHPGVFDTSYFGTLNASGSDLCLNLSAPCTRSLAYYSTAPDNYCSDQSVLGNWTASHGQTFVATGNRVIALKAFMAAGFNVHFYWTVQILEGGPNGTPIGPPRSTRVLVDGEYFPILVTWGVNDVQVVPGRTYYFRVTRTEGVNVYRVNRDNYPDGNYFENDVSVPGAELMGLVVCADYIDAGPVGTLTGFVHDTDNNPLPGALVKLTDLGLYSTTVEDGSYAVPYIPAGIYDVIASKAGYVAEVNSAVAIEDGLETISSFTLALQTNTPSGAIVTNGSSLLQPFEALPGWSSSFDASWGSAATFGIVPGGQSGNALEGVRTGPGSSARAQVLPVKPNTLYQLSVWIRCPSFGSGYWAEFGYKNGNFTAQDFDGNSGTWTVVKKFSDTGVNGNGNVWTLYSANFNSGASSQVSVGFKLGAATGTGPTVQWDQLSLVSLVLLGLASAIANSPSNVAVCFTEPVRETAATNLANIRLVSGAGALPLLGASLVNGTNLTLATAAQAWRTDYTLTVSNITALVQPAGLTGRNGQLTVRAPMALLSLDDATLWKFEQSGTDLGTAWRAKGYNDAAWPDGAAPLGWSSGPLPDVLRTALSPATNKITFYFRKHFSIPSTVTNVLLRLRTLIDDGAVFWLNGAELLRLGITNNPVTFTTRASRAIGLAAWEGPFDVPGTSLTPGTNVLAVEVHQVDPASPDVVFGTSLEALVWPSQIPATNVVLALSRQPGAINFTWTEPAVTLESATDPAGPWSPFLGATNSLTVFTTNGWRFFRLRQ
jgi:hypothetical protein